MRHISSPPVTPSVQPASAYFDHITAELRRYDEHLHDVCGLANGRLTSQTSRSSAIGRPTR